VLKKLHEVYDKTSFIEYELVVYASDKIVDCVIF